MAEQHNPDLSETHRQLQDVSKSLQEIASTVKAKRDDNAKDKWDKFNALSPFVTGLIVAIVGGLFTVSQERRNEILKQHYRAKIVPCSMQHNPKSVEHAL